jgi:hypothetical protein
MDDKGEGEDMFYDCDEGGDSKYFPEVNEDLEHEIKKHDDKKYSAASLFKEDVGVEPLDGDDKDIYSQVESVGPYSFVDCRQDYDPK